MKLELLAPAKNADFGREAINHGADALYLGAPAFGARAAATNTIEDIEALVKYAHLYGSKIFATVNTILFDDELEAAVAMIRQLYNIGVDALIIQDLGLLECDLPPIELHASTQCHNNSVERVKFMEQAGFRRVILARETSLELMREMRKATSVDLEAFIHGALCVSYSGQCYMSQYLNGRSGNRGCCSQPCRSQYDLIVGDRTLIRNKHLLSLKDFNASQQLASMIDAGITSFKIEGRLKDLSYVKNITAYYRQLLDKMMDGDQWRNDDGVLLHSRSSSGKTTLFFTPDPYRTFNRGYTDYFLRGRQPMASFATQKSMGKKIGKVVNVNRNTITIDGSEPYTNGDGLCFFNSEGTMQGFLVNNVNGRTIVPNNMPDIKVGTLVWRNNDMQFERLLKGKTAERQIDVSLVFNATEQGFSLSATDEDGITATGIILTEQQKSTGDAAACSALIVKQLSKTGGTPYHSATIEDKTDGYYFIPSSLLNHLRRDTLEQLTAQRIDYFRPKDTRRSDSGATYPAATVDYRANIVNSKAEKFYNNHGANVLEHGLEQTKDYTDKALMTTKYCLRYELGCCLQGKSKQPCTIDIKPSDTLTLHNNGKRFRLLFDCNECQMRIVSEQ